MTTTSSWMMMLAVMYGMMPSAKTDSRSSAPPENRFTSEYTSAELEFCAWVRQVLIAEMETPGPGTLAPSRYTAIIARENNSLRRRSGVRNAAANACSTCPPLLGPMRLQPAGRECRQAGTRRPPDRAPPRRSPDPGVRVSDLGGAPAGGADLLGRRGGEGVRVHVQLDAAQLAVAEHLDRAAAPDGTGVGQAVGVDRPALREQRGQPLQVHDLEDDLVAVLEAGQLGQPHVQRRLPALEPGRDVPTGAGAL